MGVEELISEDSLSCGLRTTVMPDADPYCFRVGWIAWNSPFRAAGLRIEDRIIGVNGVRYGKRTDAKQAKEVRDFAIGQVAERQYWRKLGAHAGQLVTLEVKRDREILQIKGGLVPEATWLNGQARLMSPTGPERLGRDGFNSTWSTWYDGQIVDVGWKILDGSLHFGHINTRTELQSHRLSAARVDFLAKKYPGTFADTVVADYKAIEAYLLGRRYDIKPADLEWRSIGEARAKQIADVSSAARKAFVKRFTAERIEAFPAADALNTEARAKVAGKVVELPTLKSENWLMNAGKPWMVSEGQGGRYFLGVESPPLHRFFMAVYRYTKSVRPAISESYSIIGRILPDPRMFVRDGVAIGGLEVEPIAVSAGEDLFVDLTAGVAASEKTDEKKLKERIALFAGEEALANVVIPMPRNDAPPAEVLKAFFHCLKIGEEDEWRAFFATWDASRWDQQVYYYALRPPGESLLSSEWVRARRLILDKIVDVCIIWTSEERVLQERGAFEGAPRVDEVHIEVDHVALFDGEYRAFADAGVHRLWTLQRVESGPWRIAADSQHGI
jgi:hypothetical protein